MLNRIQVKELGSVIKDDYPSELFQAQIKMSYDTHDARAAGYTDCCAMRLWGCENFQHRYDTTLLAPMRLPYEKSEFLNPFSITHSKWLRNDLGLADVEGEFTFLFGRASWDQRYTNAPLNLNFYTINAPGNSNEIRDLLIICKRRNSHDQETEHEWRRINYDDEKSGITMYRRTTDTVDGYYWVLEVCPLGFRYTGTDAKGQYYFEGTDTCYRSFTRFIKARADGVRQFCTKILEAWNNGESTDDLVPDGVTLPALRPSSATDCLCEPAKMSCGKSADKTDIGALSPEGFCEQLNARLRALREQEGFGAVELYRYDGHNFGDNEVKFGLQPDGKTRHTYAQALRHVERLEFFARMHKEYLPRFTELRRDLIDEAMLHLDNPRYVEIEVPAAMFGISDSYTTVRRFSYSLGGLVAAREYATQLEETWEKNWHKLNDKD